ncbi:MAG: type II secretion system protein N [Candidatus Contendobacter sp.]
MKHVLRYSLLGLLAFLLSLLLLAPATLVTDLLAQRLTGFSVQAVEGLATEGSARGVHWRGVRIERLNWNWRAPALLTGWLEFRLDADDPEIKLSGSVAANPGRRLRFRDLSGRLPLARLGALAGQPGLPLQGVVEFNLRDLSLNAAGRPQTADGVVYLLNARATLGQPLNLGDFIVQLAPATPEGIQGAVRDNDGPLALEGTLNLLPDGRYRFTGQAAVRDAGNQALRQAMNLLGPPGGDGRWTLSFSGVLPQ